MRRLVAVASLLLLALLPAACGGDDKPAAGGFPGNDWAVEYTRSGGIAGITERISVDSKGAYLAENQRQNTMRRGFLASSQTSELLKAMRAADLPSLKSDQAFPRPDAFISSIRVASNNQEYGGSFISPPGSAEMAALLKRLAELYETYKP
jgi:hypothetical protein